jgi:hypothetical protein
MSASAPAQHHDTCITHTRKHTLTPGHNFSARAPGWSSEWRSPWHWPPNNRRLQQTRRQHHALERKKEKKREVNGYLERDLYRDTASSLCPASSYSKPSSDIASKLPCDYTTVSKCLCCVCLLCADAVLEQGTALCYALVHLCTSIKKNAHGAFLTMTLLFAYL